ncbi:hypothetical protein [Desulfosarcina cetonica]|uniref:hypothetical protein n=1 Tax=Desulfosarcina cetonica TaxID=90730 RepID=UPI0006CF9C0E|nr:hypothetical protein [Desulfosarcina cetonica]
MFEFFSKKKRSRSSNVRTVSIVDLAPLWRDPNEGITGNGQTEDDNSDDSQKGVVGGGSDSNTNMEDRTINSDSKPKEGILEDENEAWFDENVFRS